MVGPKSAQNTGKKPEDIRKKTVLVFRQNRLYWVRRFFSQLEFMARDNFYTPESGRGTTRPLIEDDDLASPSSAELTDDLLADELDSEPESEPQFLRASKRVAVRKGS